MPKKKKAANEAIDSGISLGGKAQAVIGEIFEEHFPRLGFTLDKNTLAMIDALSRSNHNSRGAIARTIISEVMNSPELYPVAEFYEDTWRKVYFRADQLKSAVQLLLPRAFNVYLVKTSEQILGESNRSEMFRILVALYATKKRLFKRVSTEVFEFVEQ